MNTNKLSIMQDRFISSLMEPNEYSNKEISERLHSLELHHIKPPYRAIVVMINHNNIENDVKDSILYDLNSYITNELIINGLDCASTTNAKYRMIFLIGFNNKEINFSRLLEDINKSIFNNYLVRPYIGIGEEVNNLNEVYLSRNDADEALSYRYNYEKNGVINGDNIVHFIYRSRISNKKEYDDIIFDFVSGNLSLMEKRVNELVEKIRYTPNVSKESIKRTMIELTVQILNISSNNYVDTERVLNNIDPYRWILKQNHTEIIVEWFMKLCNDLVKEMNEVKNSKEHDIIIKVKNYIDSNLSNNDLGLNSICKYIDMSTSYLSFLFSKETGQGINSYISEKRLNKARYLLKNTDIKISDIAFQCGFRSESYFAQFFKRNTKMTANQYRKK